MQLHESVISFLPVEICSFFLLLAVRRPSFIFPRKQGLQTANAVAIVRDCKTREIIPVRGERKKFASDSSILESRAHANKLQLNNYK